MLRGSVVLFGDDVVKDAPMGSNMAEDALSMVIGDALGNVLDNAPGRMPDEIVVSSGTAALSSTVNRGTSVLSIDTGLGADAGICTMRNISTKRKGSEIWVYTY